MGGVLNEQETLNEKLLAPDPGAVVPRISMGELGTVGLRVSNRKVLQEVDSELRMPNLVRVVDKMKKDATIGMALHLMRMMIGKVNWRVEAPIGATKEQEERAKFIGTCMNDMDHSWSSFINEVVSYIDYGFSIHEKVFRRRLKSKGSKYNDGLVGIKSLPIRNQYTIFGWKWDDTGREVTHVIQSLQNVSDPFKLLVVNKGRVNIWIPREKYLHFTCDTQLNNPEGYSPLKTCYVAWRYRTLIEEQEAIGTSRDLSGVPIARLPARYMSENASPDEQSAYAYVQNMVRNVHNNEQAGMVFPSDVDEMSGKPLFDFSLLANPGGKSANISAIIDRWDKKILTALYADVRILGQDGAGSFALAGAKTNIVAMNLEYRLKEIQTVLNGDLIPHLFRANGWEDEVLPTFEFDGFDDIDLEVFSAAIQRMFAVGAVEVDRPILNKIRKSLGVDEKPADAPVDKSILSGQDVQSKSGEGLSTATGGLSGTSNSVSKRDNSAANKSNK